MKINGTKVFKHQFWLCRDGLVMLITDIREGETYPIRGVLGSYGDNPAAELSWQADGQVAGSKEHDLDNYDLIRRVTDIQIGRALEEAA